MQLPNEIWLYILTYLDIKAVNKVRTLSHYFLGLVEDESFLKTFCNNLKIPLLCKQNTTTILTDYKPDHKSWLWFFKAYHYKKNSTIGRREYGQGIYYGEWLDNRPHGYGIYDTKNTIYIGQWNNGTYHEGTTIYNDGDKFIGKYKNQLRSEGIYYFIQGDIYIGEWQNGKFHGYGIYKWSDGRKYIGNWINENEHGFGILKFPDGHKYIGQWIKAKRHGFGKLKYKNKTLYKGHWENDHPITGNLPWDNFCNISFVERRKLISEKFPKNK